MLTLLAMTFAHADNPANAWSSFPTFYISPAIGSDYTGPMTEVFNDFWFIPVNFETFLATDDDYSVALYNGESEIAFTSSLSLLCGNGADGCCWTVNDNNGRRIESDIYLDSTVYWSTSKYKFNTYGYGNNLRPFRTTFLHEYGHAVGLGHENAVMNMMGQDWNYVSTNGILMDVRIGEDALTGLRNLYGDWPGMTDVRAMHWKYSGASGQYSTHTRTRLLNKTTALELPLYFPLWPQPQVGDWGEKVYRVTPGQAITVEYTLENLGTDALPTVPFRVYLSNNNVISNSDQMLFDAEFAWLYPNTPYTGQFTMTVPWNMVRGEDYWIGIRLDPNGLYAEHDEGNNYTYLGTIIVP